MEFDVPIREKVDLAGVGPVIAVAADNRMFLVGNGSELEKRSVKVRESRKVVRAKIEMMEFELHGILSLNIDSRDWRYLADETGISGTRLRVVTGVQA
jgi:hypothetical protein